MRIARLDVARYGRFTDQSLDLPRRPRDFHLLVGPNEAGKSTLRSAILDLLFGIETRSPYNFRHAYPDLRLGALIEQGDANLDFRRVKARTRTLRDHKDAELPEGALAPYLGGIGRGFFEQMFGLDHGRLVAGGRDILSAANDLGQMLFQSAAGIAGFGAVREALEREADALWAKRRSADREFYIAADELERARETLKQVSVRTGDWEGANRQVAGLAREGAALRERYNDLARQQARLERARRTVPILDELRVKEAARAALGVVRRLPEDAARRLADAEQVMAQAASAQRLHETQAEEKTKAREGLNPDRALLARAGDIEALVAGRERVRNHPADLDQQRAAASARWQTVQGLVRQLGWPPLDEAALAARIPPRVTRADAEALIARHGLLVRDLENAREAHAARARELRDIDQALAEAPAKPLPPALSDALAAARDLGDGAAQERALDARVAQAARALDQARADLGPWPLEPARLRPLQLPGGEELQGLKEARNRLQGEAGSLAREVAGHEDRLADLALEIAQYQAAHQPVSREDLMAARARRDDLWRDIRAGGAPLSSAADPFEALVVTADDLADRRHNKAREAARLQASRDEHARLHARLERDRAALAALQARNDSAAADWAARMQGLGLAGMTLDQLGPWSIARQQCLAADDALTDARAQRDDLRRRHAGARAALAAALTPPPAPGESLAALVRRAAEQVEQAGQAQARRSALAEQRASVGAALEALDGRLKQANDQLAAWREDWARCLRALHLPAGTDTAGAGAALGLFAEIESQQDGLRGLREGQIVPMERDLARFADMAQGLALALDPALAGHPPEALAGVLGARLAQARQDDRDHARLTDELALARQQAAREAARSAAARAGLAPLLDAAGVGDLAALRGAIEATDQARALDQTLDDLRQRLTEAADGLAREPLEADLAGLAPGAIPAELDGLRRDQDALMEQQRHNAAELRSAQTALARIAGQDDAARAEAARQEALARMGNAVERYLRTRTAARLLRWAIERYREARQGPLLGRAGSLFAALTLGSFERLVVDHDQDPPVLHGQRPDGERVGITGLSDGTRDQLYLALRLAALELHLQQSPPMPFIADDLFINWDDARAAAGLAALADLSVRTQVIFLTHHEHLVPHAERVFGDQASIIRLA